MYTQILKYFHLDDQSVLNVYSYGSRVYQTHSEYSDYDFIVIDNLDSQGFDLSSYDGKINIHLYGKNAFQHQINQHKISALECFFLPQEKLLKNSHQFHFTLDKAILRTSISEKASHAWVKAKKKFEVEKDRNIYIAKKSLFHSLRIIDFGIQTAQNGQILDYASSNQIWHDIKNNPSEDWTDYKDIYQELFNHRMTEFRKLAPKN